MSEFPEVGTPLFYGVFFTAVLLMVAVDMFSLRKNGSHKVSIKEALAWSGLWVAVSCLFAGWLYIELAGNPMYGAAVAKEKVLEFFTGYILEKSLAVDNIFVFLMMSFLINLLRRERGLSLLSQLLQSNSLMLKLRN